MIKHRRIAAAAIGLLSLTGLACGTRLDRQGTIDDMVDAGIDAAVAECIVDKSVDAVGEDKLINDDKLTAEDEATIQQISLECLTE